ISATAIALLQSATNLSTPNWVTANDAVSMAAATVSNALPARYFRLIYTNPPAGMALVPAGSFTMGDTLDGEPDAIPTNIYVSGFYMDVDLVTYGLWTNVYAYATANGYSFVYAGAGKNSVTNQPVQTVDWYDCVKWCNARSQLAGLTPVYYTDAGLTSVYKTGEVAPYVNWEANGYRLPTEAEWERAARGGLSGRRFPWGNRIDENQANYDSLTNINYDWGPNGYNPIGYASGFPYTTPVGSFDVNGYGLYDMAGNVNEWCWDWYGTPYGQPTPTNPTGPATGTSRVLRGGHSGEPAYYARCAGRASAVPIVFGNELGFRCVRGL
ncbi:MAG TPA: SUMF1/EgtB/PvdO family nonheme iron enzyme, partial [Pseudomonadales bacterium]|nr:SUMF1/EgtB/PvdO family nonheme iron enzyme [Pseudomonadales bacterium]